MHAFIFIGTVWETRKAHIEQKIKEWEIKPLDIVALTQEERTIGIDEIREFKKRLLLVPYQSPYTVGILYNMHLLTTEAQNALLKLLEEPPPHTRILGETAYINSLLPTILSRCHIVHIGNVLSIQSTEEKTHCIETIQQIQQASVGRRIQMTEEISKTRDSAKQWVNLALVGARDLLIADPTSQKTSKLIRRLMNAKEQLEANVTPKLIIDTIFL
jgi:DNA polymerase III delta prime subunit